VNDAILLPLLRQSSWRRLFLVFTALLVPPFIYWGALQPDAELRHVVSLALYMFSAAIMCALAFIVAWTLPLHGRRWPISVIVYTAFGYIVTLAHEQAAYSVYSKYHLTDQPLTTTLVAGPRATTIAILANMLIAGNAVAYAVRAHAREQAANSIERELAAVRMESATMTLDPEDTFDTLASIRVSLRSDPEGALEAIANLGDRLRARIGKTQQSDPS
jgi:hypothetical protein